MNESFPSVSTYKSEKINESNNSYFQENEEDIENQLFDCESSDIGIKIKDIDGKPSKIYLAFKEVKRKIKSMGRYSIFATTIFFLFITFFMIAMMLSFKYGYSTDETFCLFICIFVTTAASLCQHKLMRKLDPDFQAKKQKLSEELFKRPVQVSFSSVVEVCYI